MQAQGTRFTGDFEQAAALFEESLALNRRIGDLGMVGVELHNLGHVEIHRGNIDQAERYFVECEPLEGFRRRLRRGNGESESSRRRIRPRRTRSSHGLPGRRGFGARGEPDWTWLRTTGSSSTGFVGI